jgi:hypothetical protein
MEAGKIMQSLLTSNEFTYDSLFEGLWNNGIDAETRIRDIEEGTDSANLEMIQNSHQAEEKKACLESSKNCERRGIDYVFNTKRFS